MSKYRQHGGKSGHDDHHHGHGSDDKGIKLKGTNSDNVLPGTELNDILFGGKGNDLLTGLGGNDKLKGGKGDDFLDGGAGNDKVLGGKGDDVANFTLSENLGAHDFYDGGKGFDTLKLTLTDAEFDAAKAEIDKFEAFLADGGKVFHFESLGLTVRNFEDVKIERVGGGNTAPVAVNDTAITNEDTRVVIDVLANDTDADGSALIVTLDAAPAHGSVALNTDGSFTYTPNADFNGTDSFTYVANDGALDSSPATVSLTVNAVNDAPVAGDDTITATAVDGRIHVAVVGKQNVPGELDGSSYIAAAGQLNPALFNATAIAHTATADWAQILQGFDVVVIGDDGIGADYTGSSIFSALFDFASAGGGVITTGWFATALNEYTNPLLPGVPDMDADKITPIASGAPSGKLAPATIDVVDQSHPITTGIISYQAEAAAHDLALALDNTPTAKTLATWTSPVSGEVRQAIAVDEVGDGRTVFLGNLYMANDAVFGTGALRSGDADLIFERAVAWAAGAGGSTATSVTIDPALLLNNDTDVDTMHADLFLSSFTQPGADGATLSLVDGNLVYTLGAQGLLDLLAGQAVSDSFDYTVGDGSGGFDTSSVNLSITGLDTLL